VVKIDSQRIHALIYIFYHRTEKGKGIGRAWIYKPSVGAGVADPEEAPVLGSFAGAMGSVVLPVAGSAPSLDRD
jgi:hypothetical protein